MENIELLRQATSNVQSLLDDPHPGLSTWNIALSRRIKALSAFISPEITQQRDALLTALEQLQEAFVHIPDDMKGNKYRSGIIKHCENMRVALNVARRAVDKATT